LNVRTTAVSVLVAFVWAGAPHRAFAEGPAPAAAAPTAPTPPASSAVVVPQTAPAPSPVPAPTPAEERHRRLPVSIDATAPSAVVERRVSLTESDGVYFFAPFRSTSAIWEDVCVSPCQVDLDRFSTYRVSARNGISSSKSFTLPQSADTLELKVDAGNLLANRAGKAVSGAGLAAVIVGVALIAGKGIFSDETRAEDAGFITGAAGLVLLAVGIPLTLATQSSVSAGGTKIGFTPRGFVF
jgi:hypothetical protein